VCLEHLYWIYTKAVLVADRGRINLNIGGKGDLPWLSDGSRFSGQGVSVLGPSLPSISAPK